MAKFHRSFQGSGDPGFRLMPSSDASASSAGLHVSEMQASSGAISALTGVPRYNGTRSVLNIVAEAFDPSAPGKPGVMVANYKLQLDPEITIGMMTYQVTRGQPFDGPVTKVTGGRPPLVFSCKEPCSLQAGLTVDPKDGHISGTAAELGEGLPPGHHGAAG